MLWESFSRRCNWRYLMDGEWSKLSPSTPFGNTCYTEEEDVEKRPLMGSNDRGVKRASIIGDVGSLHFFLYLTKKFANRNEHANQECETVYDDLDSSARILCC